MDSCSVIGRVDKSRTEAGVCSWGMRCVPCAFSRSQMVRLTSCDTRVTVTKSTEICCQFIDATGVYGRRDASTDGVVQPTLPQPQMRCGPSSSLDLDDNWALEAPRCRAQLIGFRRFCPKTTHSSSDKYASSSIAVSYFSRPVVPAQCLQFPSSLGRVVTRTKQQLAWDQPAFARAVTVTSCCLNNDAEIEGAIVVDAVVLV